MRPRRVVPLVLAAAAVAVIVVVIAAGGADNRSYRVLLHLDNAAGLREGRDVKIGGAEVGTIRSLDIGRDDVVVAELALDPDTGRIGEDARAQIKAVNLLGEKFVELHPGERSRPAPSGTVIPSARVTYPVDLDQVVDVLDADTRTRLGILINEAGAGFAGRRADFNAVLEQLPPSLDAATALLNELVADNHTLGRLVERSDRFVASLAAERHDLSRVVEAAGESMRSVGQRREELRATLARAPGALASLRRFLADLRVTTVSLGPAARAIETSAPPLTQTLAALAPFQRAAQPALADATEIAPTLTRLGAEATPVIRRSLPTLQSLVTFAQELDPLSGTLDRSIDDALTTLEGWARAIQARDGLSHVFRGHVAISPDLIRSLLARFDAPTGAPASEAERRDRRSEPRPAARPEHSEASAPRDTGGEQPAGGGEQATGPVTQLLEFLLKP